MQQCDTSALNLFKDGIVNELTVDWLYKGHFLSL